MNELIPFKFENRSIRAVVIEGEPWWVAHDVATALGYKQPHRAYKIHAKGCPKWTPLLTAGGSQNVRIISEGDVFRLIAHCPLEEGQRFEKWIFEEVLPQIRKTGGYGTADEGLLRVNKALRKIVHRYETRTILTMDDKHELISMYYRDYTLDQMRQITKKSHRLITGFLLSYLRDEKVQNELLSFIEKKEKDELFNNAVKAGALDGFFERSGANAKGVRHDS
jgi:prophage antirepressor-like protein